MHCERGCTYFVFLFPPRFPHPTNPSSCILVCGGGLQRGFFYSEDGGEEETQKSDGDGATPAVPATLPPQLRYRQKNIRAADIRSRPCPPLPSEGQGSLPSPPFLAIDAHSCRRGLWLLISSIVRSSIRLRYFFSPFFFRVSYDIPGTFFPSSPLWKRAPLSPPPSLLMQIQCEKEERRGASYKRVRGRRERRERG